MTTDVDITLTSADLLSLRSHMALAGVLTAGKQMGSEVDPVYGQILDHLQGAQSIIDRAEMRVLYPEDARVLDLFDSWREPECECGQAVLCAGSTCLDCQSALEREAFADLEAAQR